MSLPTRAEIRSGLTRMTNLSPAVLEILPRLNDETFDVNELARMVGQDPILSARVLRLANSPFYGLTRQVGSLREAVLVLGFSNLRSVVLAAGLIGAFANSQDIARSLATAAAAKSIAESLALDSNMAFTAGLMHNLGALLLGHFAPNDWSAFSHGSMETTDVRLLRERQTFGFDHCELGADIAADWRFPLQIQQAIRFHERPPETPSDELTDLVHVAWAINNMDLSDAPVQIAPAVMRRLQLDSTEGEAILIKASQAVHDSRCRMERF